MSELLAFPQPQQGQGGVLNFSMMVSA